MSKVELSTIERKILNYIQRDIPLKKRPFGDLSRQLDLDEDKLLARIKHLKNRGIIRSFAAGINHRKLGFTSSLIALKVPSSKLEKVVKKIIRIEEITHCFLRKGEYNLWVVFLTLDRKRLKDFLSNISAQIGRENVLNLPTKKQFKLKTKLKI